MSYQSQKTLFTYKSQFYKKMQKESLFLKKQKVKVTPRAWQRRNAKCEKAKDINVIDFSKILYLVINPFLGASDLRI